MSPDFGGQAGEQILRSDHVITQLSIAIGFAMKDIIQNLVSGILVQLDKPFEKGDTIEVQSFVGMVMRMRVRTTVLQTEKGELVHIPNSVFATKPVVNKNLSKTASGST